MSAHTSKSIALTPPEHSTNAGIDQAVEWLLETPRDQWPAEPIVCVLQERFGLRVVEAIEAIGEAAEMRRRAYADRI